MHSELIQFVKMSTFLSVFTFCSHSLSLFCFTPPRKKQQPSSKEKAKSIKLISNDHLEFNGSLSKVLDSLSLSLSLSKQFDRVVWSISVSTISPRIQQQSSESKICRSKSVLKRPHWFAFLLLFLPRHSAVEPHTHTVLLLDIDQNLFWSD